MVARLAGNEIGIIGLEAVAAQFDVLSLHFSGGNEENQEKPP
jgi:hypothetical protein